MKRTTLVLGFSVVAACHRKPLAPVVPPPPAPQARAPRPVPKPPPAAIPAASQPVQRTPQSLQSATDATGDRPAIETRLRDVRVQLDALQKRSLSGAAAEDRARIGSLLELAQQALTRGNLRQAEDLSTRAAMLAKTLLNAR